jgi:ligand-binding sensor domain-containing protein
MNLQWLQPAIELTFLEQDSRAHGRFARLVIVWFTVCLFAAAAFALDPQKSITQLVHTAWTEKDGAPADIVAITQTSDGYLWLGTWTGLFSFDGVRFTRFEPQAGEQSPAQSIRRLLATRDGSLWIVFYSGAVSQLKGSQSSTDFGDVARKDRSLLSRICGRFVLVPAVFRACDKGPFAVL